MAESEASVWVVGLSISMATCFICKKKKKLVPMQQPEFYKTGEEEQHRESECIGAAAARLRGGADINNPPAVL